MTNGAKFIQGQQRPYWLKFNKLPGLSTDLTHSSWAFRALLLKKNSEIIYTTNAGWVRAIYKTLIEAGLDSDTLFKQFYIPLEVLTLPDLRVDVKKLRKLWTFVT